jgi:phosphate transport system substrate-binding protein
LVCFPTAISGIVPVVNLPGIRTNELSLTGALLADIFARKIKQWNDPAIAGQNPQLKLPGIPIVLVVRQDGSGSTFNFTDYLSKVSPTWKSGAGTGALVSWPTDAVKVKGSDGVATEIQKTAGAIGYIEFSYVLNEKLSAVKLKNRAGAYVAAGIPGFSAALADSSWRFKLVFDETLTDKGGSAAWPITMATFVIMPQVTNDAAKTTSALKFFVWSFIHGEEIVGNGAFIRLSDTVQAQVFRLLLQIQDSKGQHLPVQVM